MKNKDDPKAQAQAARIHDHYKRMADEMVLEFRDDDEFIKRLSDVLRRKAVGGKLLGIGIYD
jgi:hypothetical protein